jgi:hypothetical protein
MNLTQFAEQYRLKIRKDACGDELIAARKIDRGIIAAMDRLEDHHHVHEIDGRFFLYVNYSTKARMNVARKKLVPAGALIINDGETDSIFGFDSENTELVKLVLKIARLKGKRVLTDEQKEAMRARLTKKVS